MFAVSSKRALISTSASTALPASAAAMSASTMGLSPEVRYSVCLMASTLGSRAACSRNACTLVENDSYGWCTSTSWRAIEAKMSGAAFGSTGSRLTLVVGTCRGYLSSGRSMRFSWNRPPRSRGAGSRYTSCSVMSSSRTSRPRVTASMSSVISRRIGGPNRRLRICFSRAWMRFSLSSSSTSTSSLRVTRNSWWAMISMPGNRSPRWLEMRSSRGM